MPVATVPGETAKAAVHQLATWKQSGADASGATGAPVAFFLLTGP